MKKLNILSLILTFLLTVSAVSSAAAQEETPPPEFQNQKRARPFRIMQELGLTRDQIQQIQRINRERRPLMQDAQRRWRMANRDLDLAIYADDSTDEEVKELMKEAQIAQAELLKERTLTEYLIRKVLTADQLVKFRDLRRQLIEERQDERKNVDNQVNPNRRQRPFNRVQRRQNQNREQ